MPTVRTVLDRLGDPEEIVQAAGDPGASATAGTAPQHHDHEPLTGRRALIMAIIAVTLTVGGTVLRSSVGQSEPS